MDPSNQHASQPSSASERPQYHHFIPRLILRGFAQGQSSNSQTKKGKRSKDGELRFVNTRDGTLKSSLLSGHYGRFNMYREPNAADRFGLEKKLSRLEDRAGRVIAHAKRTFQQPGAVLTLSRKDKDALRRFLFLMKYRNGNFHSRFNMATLDEYRADDKQKMERYMREHGYREPREVWRANLHAFLDIEIDPDWNWIAEVKQRAYPDDAQLFELHMSQSYMAFCAPEHSRDEFLLTDNVFGIFEGPNTTTINSVTGEVVPGVWNEWHNFAPLSADLMVLLRSNWLPGNDVEGSISREKVYQALLAMHPIPERAGSMLQDLPVKRCSTSYCAMQSGKLAFEDGYQASRSDTYTFKCFRLESQQIDLINTIFLEEAVAAKSVVYRSDAVAARSIKAYLESPRPGFKMIHEQAPDRQAYLIALEAALGSFGHHAKTQVSALSMPQIVQHPLDYGDHMARWVAFVTAAEIRTQHPRLMSLSNILEGSLDSRSGTVPRRWVTTAEQAGKIAFLHIKTDSALNRMRAARTTKIWCKETRQAFFATLQPRYIWLYIKVLRNLDKFDTDDFTKQKRPLVCEGFEDLVVLGK